MQHATERVDLAKAKRRWTEKKPVPLAAARRATFGDIKQIEQFSDIIWCCIAARLLGCCSASATNLFSETICYWMFQAGLLQTAGRFLVDFHHAAAKLQLAFC
jgi:hypothetical protein